MTLTWDRSAPALIVLDHAPVPCWCKVRNELNHLRPRRDRLGNILAPDLFRITAADGRDGPPSMPRPYPPGRWHVTGIIKHPDRDGYLWPCYIATDAHQSLEVWELDDQGLYSRPTGRMLEDYAYGLHYSSSVTTTGCIRIQYEADLRWLVELIRSEQRVGRRPELIVTDSTD